MQAGIAHATLEEAVRQGLITAEARDALVSLEARRPLDRAAAGPRDPENLRFVGGFADVFVTIGIALFLFGAWSVANGIGLSGAWPAAIVAAGAWLLAEYFTRARRMALPSIALLAIFAVSVPTALVGALNLDSLLLGWATGSQYAAPFVIAILTALAVGLYYLRFRVPIAVAAGVAALVAVVFGLGFWLAPEATLENIRPLAFVCGLAVFALAMRFDLSDPQRVTRRTDIAFWLHLLAAPLIVRSTLPGTASVTGLLLPGQPVEPADAVAVLGVFVVLACVSIVIDRRALLVSGLGFAGFALVSLLNQSGASEHARPVALLALGAFILLLSIGWRPLRGLILAGLPRSVVGRLPNTGTAS